MNYKHALLLSLLITNSTFANAVIGKVIKVKGQASALFVGNREAVKVENQMLINKDTSILTGDKSIVFVLLADNSKITIGANSKMTINLLDDSKVNVLNLQMGNARAQVEKENNSKTKLIMKTRTASLGVRGTDFQTTYNPQNNITNLLTFKGVVAIAKNEKRQISNEEIVNQLKDDKSVKLVEEARFATVTESVKAPSEPVKISAEQYTRLKIANQETQKTDQEIEKQYTKELVKTQLLYEKISIEEKENNIKAEKVVAQNKPTSGGLIDLDSGIYIPPIEKKENFNEKLNLFEAKPVIGEVSNTGDYIPPTGVEIDAKKGLIVSANAAIEVKEAVSNIKQDIQKQIEEIKKPSSKELDVDVDDTYKKYYK